MATKKKKKAQSKKRTTKKAPAPAKKAISTALALRGGDAQALEPISDADVERAVKELSDIVRDATIVYAVHVGDVIRNRIFKGDAAAMRKKGPKDRSYRKLARHPDLPMSAVTLWRMVEVSILLHRHPGLAKIRELTLSHLRAVLGLAEEIQDRLLDIAVREHWTAAQLAERASAHRPASKPGRPRGPAVLSVLSRFEKLVDEEVLAEHVKRVVDLSDTQAEEASAAIERVRGMLAKLEIALRERSGAPSATRANGAVREAADA